ncbi:hypothetical protein HK102_003394 [Quaeritorhiza haematococci]|nr:hypothetical protein HK102_003394 [Quaeritorhiza haematococci]
MLGIAIVPVMRRYPAVADLIGSYFTAMAVGVLTSEAFLHLIPEVLGLDAGPSLEINGHDERGLKKGGEKEEYVWVMSVVMLGWYVFWVLEKLLRDYHHAQQQHRIQNHHHRNAMSTEKVESESAVLNTAAPEANDHRDDTKCESPPAICMAATRSKSLIDEVKTVKPIAHLILIGDALHNFVDGLAIGASFATSAKSGVATSLAVLLHEIPHELGDHSVLIASGLTVLRATLLNALSNLTAFIGSFVGILLVTSASESGPTFPSNATSPEHDARRWILALAAGNFIYIALAGLVPELNRVHCPRQQGEINLDPGGGDVDKDAGSTLSTSSGRWAHFAAQNAGIWIGWVLMVLLALYGERVIP